MCSRQGGQQVEVTRGKGKPPEFEAEGQGDGQPVGQGAEQGCKQGTTDSAAAEQGLADNDRSQPGNNKKS